MAQQVAADPNLIVIWHGVVLSNEVLFLTPNTIMCHQCVTSGLIAGVHEGRHGVATNDIDLEVRHLVRHGISTQNPYLARQLSIKDARQSSEGYSTKVD